MKANPQQLYLKSLALEGESLEDMLGHKPNISHYDTLIAGRDTEVYGPDGALLLKLCAAAVPVDIGRATYGLLDSVNLQGSKTRSTSTFKGASKKAAPLQNGTVSKTVQFFDPITGKTAAVDSLIAGYFDRKPRFPYCRETSFLYNHPKQWAALQPYIKAVDGIYRQAHPERYKVQQSWVQATSKDFVIKDTVFTTVTINKTWQTACHRDAGDLKEGFGVISCLRAGHYTGGYLCFPRWRIAVDLQSCDVLLFDPHEIHGNTKLTGIAGKFQRITTVFYYRQNMIMAGDAAHEGAKARSRRAGDPLWSEQEQEKLARMKALAVP